MISGYQSATELGLQVIAVLSDGLIISFPYHSRQQYLRSVQEWKTATIQISTWRTSPNRTQGPLIDLELNRSIRIKLKQVLLPWKRTPKEGPSRRILVRGSTHSLIMQGKYVGQTK